MNVAEMFWKAARDFRSSDLELRKRATVTLVRMAFGPEGSVQKRAADLLHANSIAVLRNTDKSDEKTA